MEQHSEAGQQELAIAALTDVVAWGWDCAKLVREMIDFRYECIDGLTPESQPQPNEWSAICLDCPDTWRLVTAGPGKIVGYWHSLPFREATHKLAREGKLLSGMITRHMLRPLDAPGWYDFYIATLAVKREYRGMFAVILLLHSLLDVSVVLARRGILIRELCANFFTPDGKLLNNGMGLGLDYITDHQLTGVIYAGHFPSILRQQLALHGENAPAMLRELQDLYPGSP